MIKAKIIYLKIIILKNINYYYIQLITCLERLIYNL